MTDTASLVSDLLQKLAELDNKVKEYRQDMAQEFQRYSHKRLQEVPGDISANVEKMVADQFPNYPALSPGLVDHDYDHDHDFASGSQSQGNNDPATLDENAWSTITQTSPPASPQNPDIPLDDGARSPHEREREFHGLFTPSYLPLLDAVQRRSFTPPALSPQLPEEPSRSPNTSPAPQVNVILSRPDPVRRGTGDTVSSITSDDSAARSRRSALRRSSSSSIKTQSPRRVRFDVEGEEVLPTSSPPISPRVPDIPLSPLGDPTTLLDDSYNTIVMDEEANLLGSSPPMPKKITSTDRLKAMARSSTEDTSKWEVVGNLEGIDDEEEEELVMAGLNGRRANDTFHAAPTYPGSETTAHRINDSRLPSQLGAPLTAVKEVEENEAPEETEDTDDVLMMPPLSSFKDKKRFSPPLEATLAAGSKASGSQKSTKEHNQQTESSYQTKEPHLEEEDMFEFEHMEDTTSEKTDVDISNKKYIETEEEEDDEADATPIAENPVLYSTSPAVSVPKPATPTPTAPSPHQMAASAGSFRGKSFSIGIIRDPELHKKAAEMGDFYTFVGSVDGRSGVDESSSYRPELTYFNGTPRSLSERMMREDLEEARRDTEANERD
ncbi:hypothetical protein F4819DRAFT_350679 [Hypoxylon fuscum]|nr:hypothetical protein F4819DRAFT_350679 [Hypoxylon fuscum]